MEIILIYKYLTGKLREFSLPKHPSQSVAKDVLLAKLVAGTRDREFLISQKSDFIAI